MAEDQAKAISDAVVRRLVEIRKEKGISQNKLAKMAGISRTGLRHMESGEIQSTLYTLLKVSAALATDLGKLLQQEASTLE